MTDDTLLTGLPATAVPLEIERTRNTGEEYRLATARKAGLYIAEHGDKLFRSTDKRHATAKAFSVLARGLSALAFQPGGVTAFSLHWCADHAVCLAVEAAAGGAS